MCKQHINAFKNNSRAHNNCVTLKTENSLWLPKPAKAHLFCGTDAQ